MSYITDYHHQWTAILSLSLFLFSAAWITPKFGPSVAVFFFYMCCSAIYVWSFRDNRYITVEPYDQMALRYFASDSLSKMMIVIFPMMLAAKDKRAFYDDGMLLGCLFVLVNSIVILIQSMFTGCVVNNYCGGIVGNPSISAGLMAAMLPIVIDSWRRQWFLLSLAALAIFISKSSIGIGLLATYAVLWLVPWRMPKFKDAKALFAAFLSAASVFALAYISLGMELFNTSDRWKIWTYMMARWNIPSNWGFGTGWGTYHVFSINLQHYGNIAPGSYWNTLHNNWITFLFENGTAGLSLAVCVYAVAVLRSLELKNKGVSVSLLLYGLYMAMNPALNFAFPALFGAWLFLYALRRDSLQFQTVTA